MCQLEYIDKMDCKDFYTKKVEQLLIFLEDPRTFIAIFLTKIRKNKTKISGGSGIKVGPDGGLGNLFGLSQKDWQEWNDFLNKVRGLRQAKGLGDTFGSGDSDVLDDFQDERRDGFRDEFFEDLRRDQEDMDTGGYKDPGGGDSGDSGGPDNRR